MGSTEPYAQADPKLPFDIDEAIACLRVAVRPFAPAALFQLAEEGFASPFEQLLACIISIRTLDETTIECARRLNAIGLRSIVCSYLLASIFVRGRARVA